MIAPCRPPRAVEGIPFRRIGGLSMCELTNIENATSVRALRADHVAPNVICFRDGKGADDIGFSYRFRRARMPARFEAQSTGRRTPVGHCKCEGPGASTRCLLMLMRTHPDSYAIAIKWRFGPPRFLMTSTSSDGRGRTRPPFREIVSCCSTRSIRTISNV